MKSKNSICQFSSRNVGSRIFVCYSLDFSVKSHLPASPENLCSSFACLKAAANRFRLAFSMSKSTTGTRSPPPGPPQRRAQAPRKPRRAIAGTRRDRRGRGPSNHPRPGCASSPHSARDQSGRLRRSGRIGPDLRQRDSAGNSQPYFVGACAFPRFCRSRFRTFSTTFRASPRGSAGATSRRSAASTGSTEAQIGVSKAKRCRNPVARSGI